MNAGPEGIESADFEQREIEWAISLADIAEAVPFSGVRTVVDAMLAADQSE